MPTKYLVTCQCGVKLPVDLSQAGQSITCECGNVLDVPTMREIARLPQVEQAGPSYGPIRWSRLQGGVFSSGVFIAVAALLTAGLCALSRSQISTAAPPPVTDTQAWAESTLANTPPVELLEQWNDIVKSDLGPWHPPEHVVNREVSAALLWRMQFSLGVAAVGACLAASSFFLRRTERAAAK